MRKVKRRREEFILFDYQGVEKHLEKMAAKGWQLVSIENGIWIYHRKAPAQLRYSITYIPTASEYDPIETESKNRLDEYCEIVGWTKVTDWLQMQIYCTDSPDTVPIETDEEVRLNVIRKSMRKTFLISHILMIVVFGLNTFSQSLLYKSNPISFLSQNRNLLLMLIIVSGLLFIFVSLIYYAVWVVISKKSVASGGKCARVCSYRQWAFISLAWILVLAALFLLSMSKKVALITFAGIMGFFLVRYLVQKTREVLRNKGVDKYMNMVLTLTVDFVLVIVLVGGITWAGTNGLLKDEKTIEYQHYPYETLWDYESIFMSYKSYVQQSVSENHSVPLMSYEVLHVKMDSLYDWVLNNQLDRYNGISGWEGNYQEQDISDWTIEPQYPDYTRIDKVYRLYYDGYPDDEWIICKDNLIILVEADRELTEEQMKTVVLRISRDYPIEYNDTEL